MWLTAVKILKLLGPIVIFALLCIITECFSRKISLRATNSITVKSVRCVALDQTYLRYDTCSLKPINRTLKYFSIHATLLELPLTQGTAHFRILKKANGYKPFGIDVYLNICQFLAGKRNPIFDWFYDIWVPYSNLNHTCPYYHNVTLVNMPLNRITLPSVFPDGDYRIELSMVIQQIPSALIIVDMTAKEI